MLCPGCATPNEEGQDFCIKCRAPLTWHATTDPMGTIFAEGYAAGRAINQAHKPIVIWGLWLWMGPLALFFAVVLVIGLVDMIHGLIIFQFETFFAGFLGGGVSLVFLFISVPMLYKGTKNYLRQRDQKMENAEPQPSKTPVGDEGESQPAKPSPEDNLTCLACGQPIPENTFDCPACGWSYR